MDRRFFSYGRGEIRFLKVWLPLRIEFGGRETFVLFVIDEDRACDCDCVLGSLGMSLLGFKILTALGDADLLSPNNACNRVRERRSSEMEGESSRVFRVALSGPKTLPGLDPVLIKVETTTPIPAPVRNSTKCGKECTVSPVLSWNFNLITPSHSLMWTSVLKFLSRRFSFPSQLGHLAWLGRGEEWEGTNPMVKRNALFASSFGFTVSEMEFPCHSLQSWIRAIPLWCFRGGFRVSVTTVFHR